MQNRTPSRDQRPPLPDFFPVPRKCARHDGWTPERQRAFIAALADTGAVSRAAAMVNMSSEGAYFLRRQPGADGFRRAWEAALDYGVARMKDIAFERAVEGYLVPCFAGGKLLGWRRKYNDRLLMFCLRHYGQDENGRRTRVEYFSTRASAGASGAPRASQTTRSDALAWSRDAPPDRPGCASEGSDSFDVTNSVRDVPSALATAETTTVRTIISGRGDPPNLDHSTALIEAFDPAELDAPARAAILAALTDCAARRRAVAGTPDDPDRLFIAAEQPFKEMLVYDEGYSRPRRVRRQPPPADDDPVMPQTMLDQEPVLLIQPGDQFRSGPQEMSWELLDSEEEMARIEEAVASIREAQSTEAKTNDGEADALA
jgi:hypothetical protein